MLTSTLDGVGGQHDAPVWKRENLLPVPEFETRTAQAVASRYNGYDIPASRLNVQHW